jgi:Fe-S cluster assembly protein SufD
MTTTLTTGLTTPQTHLDAFAALEKTLPGSDRPTVVRLRKAAIARFGELGFPNERNEDWKFTSVAPLVRTLFQLPPGDSEESVNRFRENLLHGELSGVTLASINANVPFLLRGSQPLPQDVLVMSLAEALTRHAELVEPYLGQVADFRSHPFAALNTAFWANSAFVYVPAGRVIEQPINLWYLVSAFSDATPYLWYRRALVVLGRGSQATVVESFGGPNLPYATNALTEIVLADGARLDHYKAQEEAGQVFHLACTQAVLGRDSNFSTHYVGLGGALVRNEVRVRFDAENAEATVNGLYLASGSQHADNHTVIDHAKPHCASHELYKGILDGRARGVFNGKIFVRSQAQKTDAKQTNQTLLLSDDATINTKPQLEIFADDVKCTHGATVGQLDEQQLFYLRTRGVGLEQARALLTFAFANDIVGRIRVPALRDRLEKVLLAARHLPRLDETEDER